MSSHRRERVADLIRGALARALREEVRDPRVGFVTVTDVDLSPDLKHARVFITTMESGPQREGSLDALNRAAPFLRKTLARELNLRYVPRLDFRADETPETGSRIEALLDAWNRDRPKEDE